jgi:hypothetical protein
MIDYNETFDDYNETSEMINGSAANQPHHLGLLMLRGISSTGQFGHTKQCVINAVDINYLMLADEVTAIILYLPHNMDEELPCTDMPAPAITAPPIHALATARRGSHGGRGHPDRGGRIGCGLPNKYGACGSLDRILSSCTVSDAALLKCTLAKRKKVMQKYGTPSNTTSTMQS